MRYLQTIVLLIACNAASAAVIGVASASEKERGKEIVIPQNLPPPAAPTPMQAIERGLLTVAPSPPPVLAPTGVSPAFVGGAPQPGRENSTPTNAHQNPTPSGIFGATVTKRLPERSARGSGGGFNSSPFGHPWYRDGGGPI